MLHSPQEHYHPVYSFSRKDQFSPAISNEQDLPYYLIQEVVVYDWPISSEHTQISRLSSRLRYYSLFVGGFCVTTHFYTRLGGEQLLYMNIQLLISGCIYYGDFTVENS